MPHTTICISSPTTASGGFPDEILGQPAWYTNEDTDEVPGIAYVYNGTDGREHIRLFSEAGVEVLPLPAVGTWGLGTLTDKITSFWTRSVGQTFPSLLLNTAHTVSVARQTILQGWALSPISGVKVPALVHVTFDANALADQAVVTVRYDEAGTVASLGPYTSISLSTFGINWGLGAVPVEESAVVDVSIAAGTSLSPAIFLNKRTVSKLLVPANWTAAQITFQISEDGVTFYPLYSSAGTNILSSGSNPPAAFQLATPITKVNYIKIQSGTFAAPILQVANTTLKVVTVN